MAELDASESRRPRQTSEQEKPLLTALVKGSHQWVRDLNRWANGSVIDQDFAVVLSVDELVSVARATRRRLIVMVDSEYHSVIPRLSQASEELDVQTVVVRSTPRTPIDVPSGVTTIDYPFTPDELGVLTSTLQAQNILDPYSGAEQPRLRQLDAPNASPKVSPTTTVGSRLIGVLGVGGSGASTIAMALAQTLAENHKVVLVDLCAQADLSMYHDLDRALGGLADLMAAARKATPKTSQIRRYCIPTMGRGYFLLPGIRRQEETSIWREKHLDDLFGALLSEFDFVVCDLDGSYRSANTRAAIGEPSTTLGTEVALSRADAIVLTVGGDLRGIHGGLRIYQRLLGDSTANTPMALCVNRIPRKPMARSAHGDFNLAKLTSDIAASAERGVASEIPLASGSQPKPEILMIREERGLDRIHEAVRPLPRGLGTPLARWCEGLVSKKSEMIQRSDPFGSRIMPGELSASGVLNDLWY